MRTLDLNIDLGEQRSLRGADEPEELWSIATVVNVACGGHAGDAGSMTRAVVLALGRGARIAAHPSYPDRAGFGRRARFCDAPAVLAAVESQCTRLHEIAEAHGAEITAVKPHGALYHDAAGDADYAAALLDGAARALPALRSVVGPPDTALEDIVRVRGLVYERECFGDRRYDDALRIVPRSRRDALLTEPDACVSQALMLARMEQFDTLCMHGDTPGAVVLARAVRDALAREGLLGGARRADPALR